MSISYLHDLYRSFHMRLVKLDLFRKLRCAHDTCHLVNYTLIIIGLFTKTLNTVSEDLDVYGKEIR